MKVIDIIIPTVWIAFWIYWLAASARTKATRARPAGALAVRIAIVLVVLALFRTRTFSGHAAPTHDPWLLGIGLTVFLLGLAFAVWARVYLGRNWGTPMSQKVDAELVTTGPYRYVRHPIYSGIVLGMVGTGLAVTTYFLAAAALFGAYFAYSAGVEERNMERLFPESYPAYRRSTKRLIPFIF